METNRVERRLAAIVMADVAGYSRLMGADEAGTVALLKRHRSETWTPSIVEHGGRVIDMAGDSALVEFPSVTGAIACAVAIQRAMGAHNAALPDERRMELRFGIHSGEIIIDGPAIFGDAVNVAARLQALARPGGICVSDRVQVEAAGKIAVGFEDMGEQPVKNITRPVRAWRVLWDGAAAASATPAGGDTLRGLPVLSDKPSLAVLPFTNMSGDPDQEYFADGMVEDIITGLSRMRWLFVIARNSSFTYKGRAVDVKQVGRELGVRYVLEGSVRKAGNKVRITGQLVEAETGAHIWADRFDGALDDIFALQDEITISVVGAIEPSLRRAEIERSKRKRPENLDAYDLYLRALPHAAVAMPGDAEKALVLLNQALALQPDYAAAHAAAAWCHEMRYIRGGLQDADRTAGLRHARAALAAGADDATTLATVGFVIGLLEHDYAAAMSVIDRALALNGFSALALGLGAIVLAHAGHIASAIEYAERALRLSPHDPTIYRPLTALGMAHCAAGNFEEAAAACAKATHANPHFSIPRVLQTAALSCLGRDDEAKAAARRVLEVEPHFRVTDFVRAHTGRPEIWTPIGEALRRVGLPE